MTVFFPFLVLKYVGTDGLERQSGGMCEGNVPSVSVCVGRGLGGVSSRAFSLPSALHGASSTSSPLQTSGVWENTQTHTQTHTLTCTQTETASKHRKALNSEYLVE